jgi:mycothiol synthase
VHTRFPEDYTLRPPRPADGQPIVEMLNAETVAVLGVPMVSLDWIVTPWTAPGVDLERDFAVLLGPAGDLAGYLFVESDPPYSVVFSIGAVALSHHGRGVGAAVLDEAERRAQRFVDLAAPDQRVVMHAGALANEPRVAALLSAHGYVEARRFAHMQVLFHEPPTPPEPVRGVEIRPLVRGEEREVYACLAEAFSDHWGATWPTEQSWMHDHVAGTSEFHPDLWQLAWDGAELAGVLIARPKSEEDPTIGYIPIVGVRRRYRRRGIAEALLRTSFVQLHARGSRGAGLEVDTESITGADRLYERVGMTAQPRFSQWEKELRPGGA